MMNSLAPPILSSSALSAPLRKPPQRRLIIIRHGKPDVKPGLPRSDWPLSDSSQLATKSIATKLKTRKFNFKAVTSSPEVKALATAKMIARVLGLESDVKIDSDLAEHKRFSEPFLTNEEFEGKIKELFDKPGELVFGEETADEAFERFERTLEGNMTDRAGEDVLVVTHGTVMAIFVSKKLGVDAWRFWKELEMSMAVVISGEEMEIVKA